VDVGLVKTGLRWEADLVKVGPRLDAVDKATVLPRAKLDKTSIHLG
jgi:hypothetical protein